MRIGIAGAGLLGRLLAWRFVQQGHQVTLFDQQSDRSGKGSAAYAAGGMLSFLAEQETAEQLVYRLAQDSMSCWPQWLAELKKPVFFQKKGGILVAHHRDRLELNHLIERIKRRVGAEHIHQLDAEGIQQLEPELNFHDGCLLAGEGQIDGRALLNALADELIQQKIEWHVAAKVTDIKAGLIRVGDQSFKFDWVFDCRGVGATTVFADLRAVRGELIYLRAPEVQLSHVIRLLHPRYRICIIPRPNDIYLISATEINSFDDSPISVRSCLELLTAAYSVHSGFAEARILETISAMRPAFPDNLPRIYYQRGLVAINGLYRHGYLIAPALINEVMRLVDQEGENITYSNLVKEVNDYGYNI